MIKVSSEKKSNLMTAPIKLDSYFTLIDEQELLTNTIPVTGFENALKYLSRAIVQEPRNLRLHTQKIFLLLRQVNKNKPLLASALADLFIVLEGNGTVLKARMLDMSQDHLHADDWLYLKKNKQSGLTVDTPITQHSKYFSDSLLSHGLIGRTDLITHKKTSKEGDLNVSELHKQALMCLEYGQLDFALDILQQARAVDPKNNEVNADLLSIYMSLGMEAEQDTLRKDMEINIE